MTIPILSVLPMVTEFKNRSRSLRVRVTNRCNAKCSFCHGDGGAIKKLPPFTYLQHDRLKELTTILAGKFHSVALTGGEPLLHPEIAQIAHTCIEQLGAPVHLNTNGLLLKSESISEIVRAGVKDFHINLNTFDSHLYLANYGVRFPTHLMASLEHLRNEGADVIINCVVLGQHTDIDIHNILRVCTENGFALTLIEDHKSPSPRNGLGFQDRMFRLLGSVGFQLRSVVPGRCHYSKMNDVVCVAAPCAPATAWNGTQEDDAVVLHENGTLTGFLHGEARI